MRNTKNSIFIKIEIKKLLKLKQKPKYNYPLIVIYISNTLIKTNLYTLRSKPKLIDL